MLKNCGAALALVILFAVSGCGVREASQQPQSPQQHTNERAERAGENENRAKNNSGISSTAYLQKYSAYCATEPEQKDDKWRHDFFCEFKITDAIIAAFTVILAIVTAGLIIVGICQTRQVAKTIALTRAEFIATQRPWITVDVRIGGPLAYDANGANFTFVFILENIGNSPATNVWPDFKVVAPDSGPIVTHFDERKMQREIIERRKHSEKIWHGDTIFPKKTIEKRITYTITMEELSKIMKHAPIDAPLLSPSLIGAVCYYSHFSTAPNQTGFICEIRRSDVPRIESIKKNRWPPAIFTDDGTIPANELRIIRDPFMSGGYAD
jgi:hypothetical protein